MLSVISFCYCYVCIKFLLRFCYFVVLLFVFFASFSSIMSKDYGSWSVADLKNELRKRNAKVGGKKAVLVQRLEDYDKLFGPLITDPDAVFKIVIPAPDNFRDVTANSSLPVINDEDLEIFCQLTEREDIATSRNMYDEYFLMSCRVAVDSNEFYVTGMVSSEMRKNISYNVTLKLKNHLILEAQCECAAGMGPYAQCKHVLVLIMGVIDMSQNKTIKLKTSITSNLQTFHQPNKLHTGDPVKAEELRLKSNDQKYKEMVSFDPRPMVESAEDYARNFKNYIANFCGQNKKSATMPIAQLIKPADKPSIYKDHDYLKKTNEEEFLESRKLTDDERHLLEEKTRTDKKLWKRERLMRIHSSHFGKICKARNNKQKIAKSLVRNIDLTSPAIKHGLKYEEEAVRAFENKTQITTQKCGIIVHKENQFLASTPDRLIGEDCVLEVKCPYTAKGKQITPETVPYLYLCEKSGLRLKEEHDYYYQVQGQLMCTGRKMAYFCVYTISDIEIIKIEHKDRFIAMMFDKLKDFYNEYFENVIINKFLYNKKLH